MANDEKVIIIKTFDNIRYHIDRPFAIEIGTYISGEKLEKWKKIVCDYLDLQIELKRLWEVQRVKR